MCYHIIIKVHEFNECRCSAGIFLASRLETSHLFLMRVCLADISRNNHVLWVSCWTVWPRTMGFADRKINLPEGTIKVESLTWPNFKSSRLLHAKQQHKYKLKCIKLVMPVHRSTKGRFNGRNQYAHMKVLVMVTKNIVKDSQLHNSFQACSYGVRREDQLLHSTEAVQHQLSSYTYMYRKTG